MIDGMFVFDSQVNIAEQNISAALNSASTIENYIERMDYNGIDMALIMGRWALDPGDQRKINGEISQHIKKYPQYFIGLARVSPFWADKALDEINFGHDNGLRGIKLYPPGQGNYPIDSLMLDPLMELVSKNNMIVMIHTDVDSKVCHPLLGVRLANRFPSVPIILTHLGMNSDSTHFIPDYVKDSPNIYLNTSNSPNLPQFIYKTPMQVIPNRMLFGSDAPDSSPEVELKKVEVAEKLFGVTKSEKRLVLGENAANLFKIKINNIR